MFARAILFALCVAAAVSATGDKQCKGTYKKILYGDYKKFDYKIDAKIQKKGYGLCSYDYGRPGLRKCPRPAYYGPRPYVPPQCPIKYCLGKVTKGKTTCHGVVDLSYPYYIVGKQCSCSCQTKICTKYIKACYVYKKYYYLNGRVAIQYPCGCDCTLDQRKG